MRSKKASSNAYGKTTILVCKGLSRKEREETITHELVEVGRMKTGEEYRKAHREAEKAEKREASNL